MTPFENDVRKVMAEQFAHPVVIGAMVLITLVVFGFCWKHNADARSDGKIEMLEAQRDAEHQRGDSLAKLSDSLALAVTAKVDTFAKRDTLWRRHSDTLTKTVTQIVTSTVADTTKIAELAALVLTTAQKADSAISAARDVAVAAEAARRNFLSERASWNAERTTLTTEISLLKRQSRKWGLGAALGFGALRAPDGAIRAGPVLALGIVYRY